MKQRDWLWTGITVVVVGAYALLAPLSTVVSLAGRIIPILLFLATITVVVNLSAKAGVFARAARYAAHAAGGRPMLLWLLITALAVVCTAFLSLDTTAVLITPLAISLVWAVRADIVPYALIIVWVANIGSLWLPVSNLTNLLSIQSGTIEGTPQYIAETIWPALLGVGVTVGFTLVLFRNRISTGHHGTGPGGEHGTVPGGEHSTEPGTAWDAGSCSDPVSEPVSEPAAGAGAKATSPPHHPALLPCAMTLMIALPLLATPIPYWLTSSLAALVLSLVFLFTDRSPLRVGLLPWGAMALAVTLVVAVDLLHAVGAEAFVTRALSTEGEASGLVALTAGGVVASNVLNNLPAYLLLEPAVTTAPEMVALLIGVNAGPLLTPWASLATLLWADQLRRAGIAVPWRSFIVLGCLLVPLVCTVMLLPIVVRAALF